MNWWTVHYWGDLLWMFSDDEVGQNSLTSSAGSLPLTMSWLERSVSLQFCGSLSSARNKRNTPQVSSVCPYILLTCCTYSLFQQIICHTLRQFPAYGSCASSSLASMDAKFRARRPLSLSCCWVQTTQNFSDEVLRDIWKVSCSSQLF